MIEQRQIKSRQLRLQEGFALVGGFGLFAWLLVTVIGHSIHPVFPLAALLFFLSPFRREIVARRIMQLAVLVFLIWMMISLSGVLMPFIIAFILAYLTEPIARRLSRWKFPRWLSALTVVLFTVGLLVLAGLYIIPKVVNQFDALSNSVQGVMKDANSLFEKKSLQQLLEENGVSQKQAQEIVSEIQPQLKNAFTWLVGGMGQAVKNIAGLLESLFNLILIPMIWFYLLMDFDRLKAGLKRTLVRVNPQSLVYAKEVDMILISYLRGISITSSIVGILASIVLSIAGVPYAIVIGILTGVFNLIPSVGMFLNLGVAVIIFLFSPGSFWSNTLAVTLTIGGLHALNAYVVEPRVLGDRVGLHPVVLIASLFIFAYFLGFIGLLIAVPTTAVILHFLQGWFARTFPQTQTATDAVSTNNTQ